MFESSTGSGGSAGPPPEPTSPVKKFWKYSSIVLVAGLIYVGIVFFLRWNENRDLERKTQEKRAAVEQQQARDTVETLGGSSFDILGFYANPGEVHRGEESQICYGVSNAKDVSIDPPVAQVWPSVSRCFEVTPQKTQTYTLTADDDKGNKKTATLEIKVH
jgi:hypothetical protein